MPRGWRALGLLAVFASGVGTVQAQSSLDATSARRLDEVQRNDHMRLRTLAGRCLDGDFETLLPGRRLRLDAPNGNVRLDSIAGLWVRERQVRRGALWGAATGLLAGAIVAWNEDNMQYAFYGPFVGAFAGGVIAIPSERWRPIGLGNSTVPAEPCDPRFCFACVLAELDPGTNLRVQSARGMCEGEVTHASELGFTLATPSGQEKVARDEIQRLWSYQRATDKGAKVGFLIGALIGAAGLGLITAGLSQSFCSSDCPSPIGAGLLGAGIGAVLGGCTGALIGALAGSTTDTWMEIPRPAAP